MTLTRNLLTLLLTAGIFIALETGSPVNGQEIRPVGIAHSSGPCFSFKNDPNDPQFSPPKCIDGNPDTYSCFMDDSPLGTDPTTNPPKGDAPVTGDVLFDLG